MAHCPYLKHTDSNQRGGGGGLWGTIEEKPSRNTYNGHMDKAKGGRFEDRRWGWGGVVG